jgi:hypothetical protein
MKSMACFNTIIRVNLNASPARAGAAASGDKVKDVADAKARMESGI